MYVIVDHERQPVRDADGSIFVCETMREAERFLLSGERVIYTELPPEGRRGDIHLHLQD